MIGNLGMSRNHADRVHTALDCMETFLSVAGTSPNTETRNRNLMYAREAYEMARRYLSLTLASPEMLRGFEERFSEAKEVLMLVDETVTC